MHRVTYCCLYTTFHLLFMLFLCNNTVVEAKPKTVGEFKTAEGINHYRSWLDSLRDTRGKAQVEARIKRLGMGNPGDCDPVGEGVHELRIDLGPGYRVYFGEQGEKLVLLLCGGDKNTQKKDIKLAKQLWKEAKEVL